MAGRFWGGRRRGVGGGGGGECERGAGNITASQIADMVTTKSTIQRKTEKRKKETEKNPNKQNKQKPPLISMN